MAIRLKQSTASQEVPLGPFLDSTDGVTPETALTIANTDIKLWAMGATSLANKNSGGATHMASGIYYCTLDATDTATLGALVLFISVSGALPIKVECEIVTANVYDALVGGTDYLQVDVTDWKNATAPAMTGDAFARLGAPAGASVSADVASIKTDTGTTIPATLATLAGYVDTEVAAIKAKTDNLPSDPADASDIAASFSSVSGTLSTIAGYLDTEIAAIKAKTDNLPASPAATGDIPSAGAIADAVWDEATSGHVSAGTTGLALVNTDLRGSRTVIRGTAASGASTTSLTPSALSPAGTDADQFKGRILVFDNDTATAALRGQATDITASSAASLAVLTFTALTTAPASGDTFSIL